MGDEFVMVVECMVSWMELHKFMQGGHVDPVLLVQVHCCSSFGA